MSLRLDRREFLQRVALGVGAVTLGGGVLNAAAESVVTRGAYRGPNLILVRFGGGVRRRETIDPAHTYAPFFRHELAKRGTLYTNMEIVSQPGIQTSHGEGTLNILTGKFDTYKDVTGKFLSARFEAKVPTVFEYLRKQYDVSQSQTLIINGEDRIDEEFYSFSNHHLFGVNYKSNVLSLYRFKCYLLRRQIAAGQWSGQELEKKQKQLGEMESKDYRVNDPGAQSSEITKFWDRWREFYGETGFVNPRGDRLLTELALRALRELRPRLMTINYNDPDYVHWGNVTHYTRGVQIIDESLQRLVTAVEADPEYRANTVFAIVPDCGRDTNQLMACPCQHHFGGKSAHEIFALLVGPGIARGQVVDTKVHQVDIAPTIGHVMGFKADQAEGQVLEQAIA